MLSARAVSSGEKSGADTKGQLYAVAIRRNIPVHGYDRLGMNCDLVKNL